MKAMRVTKYGDPNVLQLQDAPQPKPGPSEALVRVHASGVNFVDVYMRNGAVPLPWPFPYIIGAEGAGTVEAVGDGVTAVKPGDRVAYATGKVGSYAEFQCVSVGHLAPLPKEISFEDGAAAILQGLTAHYLLHEFYPVRQGSTVLVHAAAGGMGTILLQWLKHIGAVAIGTVSTEEKAKVARESGADHVILYTKQDFAEEAKKLTGGNGVDYVIDGVGKTTFTKNLEALRVRGWTTVFGMASGVADPVVPNNLMTKSLTISGGALFNYLLTRDELILRASDLFNGLREGWLKLKIRRVFPLEQAGEAHRLLENRQSVGKFILKIGK
jgi:NADPH:quinone reductase